MARDISIQISARDNFTQAITTMRNANQGFNRDLDGLNAKMTQLNNNRVSLKIETDTMRRELREAQRQFQQTGDAADEMALRMAEADYDAAQRNLRLVSQEARQAERDILSLTDASSRASNRVGGSASSSDTSDTLGSAQTGMLQSLAGAGLGKLLGDSAANALNVGISSTFGDATGSAISTTLSGAFTGAAMGSVAGPVGAAVGAVVGGVAGGITAQAQKFEILDNNFSNYIQDIVTAQWTRQAEELSAGSGIASTRESDLLAFGTLLGGDEAGSDFQQQMIRFGNTTPFDYNQLSSMSRVLLAYGYDMEEGQANIFDQMTRIGDTGAALNLGQEGMDTIATTLGRMNSTGKVNQRYVQSLEERGIQATGYLAEAYLGENTMENRAKITEMISKNLIDGKEAAAAISDYMAGDFGGMMEKQSATFAGRMSELQDMEEEMQSAMGEGYNEKRKEGIQAQIDYLDGESGTRMTEANRLIGEYQASLENEREQILRNREQTALEQIEQEGLTGAEAGRVLAEARAEAQSDYDSSVGVKMQVESQRQTIENVRNTLETEGIYYDAGYVLGDEFSKGMAAAINTNAYGVIASAVPGSDSMWGSIQKSIGNPVYSGDSYLNSNNFIAPSMDRSNNYDFLASQYDDKFQQSRSGNAWGIPYVPYDDYVTRLHQGERVLTAEESRQMGSSTGSGQIPLINIGSLTVREEADIYRIAQELAGELKKAQMIS